MKQRYTQRRQPRGPNWQQPVDTARCAKSPDGKHRWLTTFNPPVCDACLEIDERTEHDQ